MNWIGGRSYKEGEISKGFEICVPEAQDFVHGASAGTPRVFGGTSPVVEELLEIYTPFFNLPAIFSPFPARPRHCHSPHNTTTTHLENSTALRLAPNRSVSPCSIGAIFFTDIPPIQVLCRRSDYFAETVKLAKEA